MRNNTPSSKYDAQNLFHSIGCAMRDGKNNKNATNYASMRTSVDQQLQNYDNAVAQQPNTLHSLTPLWPNKCPEKKTAYNMYKSDADEIQQIRNDLMALNGSGKPYLCPICECEPVKHLDHYVPREIMPEFSIHPQNLIYTCKNCNEEKGTIWLDANQNRIVFNAYYDTPSGLDVLVCEVDKIENDLPVAEVKENGNIQHTAESARELATYRALKIIDVYQSKVNDLMDSVCKMAQEETIRMKLDGKPIGDIWTYLSNEYQNMLRRPGLNIIQRFVFSGLCNSHVMMGWLDSHS